MKVLIVTATWMEVRLLADELNFIEETSSILRRYSYNNILIDILASGIGTTFTTFHLTDVLMHRKYSLVINIGIAGSFTRDLKIGQVVDIVSEEFADLGVEEGSTFLTLFDSGFIDSNEFPFENGVIKNMPDGIATGLPPVRGITTNKSNGRESTIRELFTKFNAHIESMEGAAVFYVCKWLGIPFFEIRAVSNYVEPRDSSQWDIPVALENLSSSVIKVLDKLDVKVS